MTYRFFVPGVPKPGGSKTGFLTKKGKIVIFDACKENKTWRDTVCFYVRKEFKSDPLQKPIELKLEFRMPRPKSHYSKKCLKPNAPYYVTTKPDITKLIRAVEDALNKVLWYDDSLIVKQSATKIYSDEPGVEIFVKELTDES